MKPRRKGYPHEWVFKAEWRSTAIKFKVEAQNEAQAIKRAEGTVLRMEGGKDCLSVTIINQIR